MLAPGYNIDPINATTEELVSFLDKSQGKYQKDRNRKMQYGNMRDMFGFNAVANQPRPYDNLFNGKDGLLKDPTYGITKKTREAGGGYDYTNANWDLIRERINTVGQNWNKNAASRTNGGLGFFLKPLGIAASFGLPILAPGLSSLSSLFSKLPSASTSVPQFLASAAAGNTAGTSSFLSALGFGGSNLSNAFKIGSLATNAIGALGSLQKPKVSLPSSSQFSSKATALLSRTSPEIQNTEDKAIEEEMLRRGRRSTILTSGSGVAEPLGVSRPAGRAATLLG